MGGQMRRTLRQFGAGDFSTRGHRVVPGKELDEARWIEARAAGAVSAAPTDRAALYSRSAAHAGACDRAVNVGARVVIRA